MTEQTATVAQVLAWADEALLAGQLGRAKYLYEQVRRTQPANPQADAGLGDVGMRAGQPGVAAALYIEALHHKAGGPVLYKLGQALIAMDAWWDARSCFAKLVQNGFTPPEGQPALEAIYNQCNAKCREAYLNSYACDPDLDFPATETEFLHEGRALSEDEATDLLNAVARAAGPQGSPEFAALNRRYLQVWRLRPEARINAGMMCGFLRDYDAAFREFRFCRWHWPCDAALLAAWGDFHCQIGRAKEAVVAANLAALFAPDLFTAWSVLGRTIHESGSRLDSAEEAFRRALALRPNDWGVLNNLNSVLQRKGRLSETIPLYRELMKRQPTNPMVWNNYLLALQYADGFTAEEVAAEHRRYGETFEIPLERHWGNYRNSREPERRLRIGFLSPDLRNHSVAYFVEPLWAELRHENADIIGYYNLATEDAVSERLKTYCQLWRNVTSYDDDRLAQQIRDDGVDILVDLAGHTGRNRLLVFARKPAPVQVTWLGHPNTTGLKAMDWRLTDAIGDPPGVDHRYTEHLWRLPDVFVAYRPLIRNPNLITSPTYAVQPTPALKNGYVTFGTCNNLAKLMPPVVALWSRILKAMPTAKLLIEAPGLNQPQFRDELLRRFTTQGVPETQLILLGRDQKKQYLRYNEIDIALDPFPCNGGTTTCDLLWMGVPLITLPGDGFMSRMGATLVKSAGHSEWVARDEDDYVNKALALASDLEHLNRMRLHAREALEKSPLRDETRFARHVMEAFRSMWRQWCGEQSGKARPLLSGSATLIQAEQAYGEILRDAQEALSQGRLGKAKSGFEQVLVEDPGHIEAEIGLAEVAAKAGRLDVAAELYLQILQREFNAQILQCLGAAMRSIGGLWEARACYHYLSQQGDKVGHGIDWTALKRDFDDVSAECRRIYEQAYGVSPEQDFPRAAQVSKRLDEAQAIRRLTSLLDSVGPEGNSEAKILAKVILKDFPRNRKARLDLANMELSSRNFSEAQHHLLYLLWHHGSDSEVLVGWVNFNIASGGVSRVFTMASLATLFDPRLFTAWAVLGGVLDVAVSRLDASEYAYKRALELKPDDWRVQNNLGNVLMRMGRMEEAVRIYRKLLETSTSPLVWHNYLLTLQYVPGLTADEVAAEHQRFGDNFSQAVRSGHSNLPDPSRRLRLGFVSPDLRNHSVAYFVEALWANLSSTAFEIYAYCSTSQEDAVSTRLKQYSSSWRNVFAMDDEQLALQIVADEIDILVDLAGHTSGNRLLVFARKPAPVQVTWLGHPNTTGLKTIDWRLTDEIADPVGVEHRYSERLWRLPEVFAAYRPLIRLPEAQRDNSAFDVQPPPVLVNGFITFGCCNNLAKITPAVVALWSQILLAVPGSKLLLEAPGLGQAAFRNELIQRFTSHGVAAERVIALERDREKQYLRYNEIDIALDPFPCNGGTTTCDLLWMGVPLVTLAGDGFMARMGASLVNAAGHAKWVVQTPEAYLAEAVSLASSPEALQRMRSEARATIERSPLRDEKGFARHVGDAFRAMWKEWCGGTYTPHPASKPHKGQARK